MFKNVSYLKQEYIGAEQSSPNIAAPEKTNDTERIEILEYRVKILERTISRLLSTLGN